MKREKTFWMREFFSRRTGEGVSPGQFGHAALFCKSYRCDRCRKPKLKKARKRISEVAEEHKLTRMVTLTLDPKRIPKRYRTHTDRYIRDCWCKMRVLLARGVWGIAAICRRPRVPEKRKCSLAFARWPLHRAKVALSGLAIHLAAVSIRYPFR